MNHVSGDDYADYSAQQDAALEREEARASRRFRDACRCGGDMPGRCPGPANCPMCQDDEEEPV